MASRKTVQPNAKDFFYSIPFHKEPIDILYTPIPKNSHCLTSHPWPIIIHIPRRGRKQNKSVKEG